MHFYLEPGGKLVGSIRVPGDKSMSHRVIMLGAIADGKTDISGFLEGEDALSTLGAFRNMGVMISEPESGRLSIEGVGLRGLQAPTVCSRTRPARCIPTVRSRSRAAHSQEEIQAAPRMMRFMARSMHSKPGWGQWTPRLTSS